MMSWTGVKPVKKSPRGRSKNVLASNTWPNLPTGQKSVQKSKPTCQDGTSKPTCQDIKTAPPATRAYVCVPADQSSDRDISALTEKVAELEVSYANLMEMYKTQIKINGALLNNISTLATYCLLSMDKRMNSAASILPAMMQQNDRRAAFKKDRAVKIVCDDDGSIICSMIEYEMHRPLVDVIFTYTNVSKLLYKHNRFVENSKLIIERTPWHLLTNNMDVHILDALKHRAEIHTSDQQSWRELYEFALEKQPASSIVMPRAWKK